MWISRPEALQGGAPVCINTSISPEPNETTVPNIEDDDFIPAETIADDEGHYGKHRQTVTACLPDIAREVAAAQVAAAISVPVFLFIPSSGRAVVSFMTPDDPDDGVWAEITGIIRNIVAEKIGMDWLHSQPLACAFVSADRLA
jgi:hypothetical protein